MSAERIRRLTATACVATVFGLIWLPWLRHSHVPTPTIQFSWVENAKGIPDDTALGEIAALGSVARVFQVYEGTEAIAPAETILAGKFDRPGAPSEEIVYPFTAPWMAAGGSDRNLLLHGFGLAGILIDAFKASDRADFLAGAARYLVEYDRYEEAAWAPGGYLWKDEWSRFARNDHAAASRISVLVDFWLAYRRSQIYEPEVAEAVFRIAHRAVHLVADPERFTAATNHGVMQNIAVCEAQLAFPDLLRAGDDCELAFERFGQQTEYLLSDEGFFLEHSFGYQIKNIELVSSLIRLLAFSGQEIPPRWLRQYDASRRMYAAMRRPDGSLPLFGDTRGGPLKGPVVTPIEGEQSLLSVEDTVIAPVAGYGIWRDGSHDGRDLSQTAFTWSHFPGMGHKHADEMSVAVWSGSVAWWDNVGYWPYHLPERGLAESWMASNAPHLAGESASSQREARLRYVGQRERLALIDLERSGPGTFWARRQVIYLPPGLWAVIDSSGGGDGTPTQTLWTTTPGVQLAEVVDEAGAYVLTDETSGRTLSAYFFDRAGTQAKRFEGSQAPFAGWSVLARSVLPVPALLLERPSDESWSVAVWSLDERQGFRSLARPQIELWEGDEQWVLNLPTETGGLVVRRTNERVDLNDGTGAPLESITLQEGPDVTQEKSEILAALGATTGRYGLANMSLLYRKKITVFLLVGLACAWFGLKVVRRVRPRWLTPAFLVLGFCWLAVSCYLISVRAQLI